MKEPRLFSLSERNEFRVAHAPRVLVVAPRHDGLSAASGLQDAPISSRASEKFVSARRRNQHARRVRYPGLRRARIMA